MTTGRSRILIVEDDVDLREALDRLRGGHRPCVILLDLTMPVMNGWQFRAEQRQDPELSRIPVIVLSAGHDLPSQMPVLGLRDYIRKPIRLESLLDSVARFCA